MPTIVLLLSAVYIALLCLQLLKKISLTHPSVQIVFLLAAPHLVMLGFLFYKRTLQPGLWPGWVFIGMAETILFIGFIWAKLHISPVKLKQDPSRRLKILMGGRTLALYGIYAGVAQTAVCTMELLFKSSLQAPLNIIIIDVAVALASVLALLANGILRMFFTSRRLSILRRVILLSTIYIPIVNIAVLLYACHVVALEYDHECNKVVNRQARVDTQVCKTKYPFVLIHGVGFRDFKYINYWGRIPKELVRNGAAVYYGNQEAWGTVEYNAHAIKERILEITNDTGCGKVNIIAHSKGGLDARYLVSMLGAADLVASLTTMSTPHRGSKAIDLLCRLPEKFYRFLARIIDRYFRRIGDKNPDFYTASRQFSTQYSKQFNEHIQDMPQVYYQSYATAMKNLFSDSLLCIPFCVVGIVERENDGLVSIDSAKWGTFRGVIRNRYRRGISHGDIIDLKREDYKGFDVIEKYVEIASELRQMGY